MCSWLGLPEPFPELHVLMLPEQTEHTFAGAGTMQLPHAIPLCCSRYNAAATCNAAFNVLMQI
jgi:hypothetical protein